MKTASNIQRYVKVEGHSNWFLVIEPNQVVPEGIEERAQSGLLEKTVMDGIYNTSPTFNQADFEARVNFAAHNTIDYAAKALKFGTILVRPNGTWTKSDKITDEKYSTHFPVDNYGDIVICENGEVAEPEWVAYLRKTYPDKTIATISGFRHRTESEIADYFSKAELVTFSTTFSDFDWYEKVKNSIRPNQGIVGYTHNKEKSQEAHEILPFTEILSL